MYILNLIYSKIILLYYFIFKHKKKKEIFIFTHLDSIFIKKNNKDFIHEKKIIKFYDYNLPDENTLNPISFNSLKIENAGGKSNISEMYSMEFFIRNYNASEFIFEKEVKYWIDFKMVDYICTINNERIGISVTRAMGYPDESDFNEQEAERLLEKKINGLIVASNSVIKLHSFYKCILHIWCQNNTIASYLSNYYDKMKYTECSKELSILLTVCPDDRIYKNYIFL